LRIAYLYSRYPVLSQTFCDTEMLELERRGIDLLIASMYPPKTPIRHEYLANLRARAHYAPEKPAMEALVNKAKRKGRWPEALINQHERNYGPDYKATLRARNALFFVELFERERIRHFHVHFTNRAAHTALFVKAISGVPFSVTAHGQDFMVDLGHEELLREICSGAEFVGAETDYSREILAARCPASADKFVRIYNGIDLRKFTSVTKTHPSPEAVRLLSVGRLVAFKGFDVLIDACAELQRNRVEFTCEIIGDGPLREDLEAQIASLNLEDRVRLSGERSQDYVLGSLAQCDAFVLAAKVDARGASDVFPTVIAEAMTSGKAVVSTTVAGIPELVVQDETGILVRPGDARAFAAAVVRITQDPALRENMGEAGRRRIEACFTIEKTVEPLLHLFKKTQAAH
jgi:glycosyltransferase involved in cell wall biosynthesis